jgi:glycosyltransferase involved in cell wall biosynthesis
MDNGPLVSIIITTYNYAEYLRRAITSCLSQSYASIEVIVVDDGSTDNTHDVLHEFGDRITTIVQETINRIFLDGQLDECELTLKNLHQIADRFRIVLMAIFHHRIDYPSTEGKEAKKERGEKWPTYGQKIGKVA